MRITKQSLCFDREGKRRDFMIDTVGGVPHIDIADKHGEYGTGNGSICSDLASDAVIRDFLFLDRAQFTPSVPHESEPPVLDGMYSGYDGLADAVSALVSAIVDGLRHGGRTYRVVVTEVTR